MNRIEGPAGDQRQGRRRSPGHGAGGQAIAAGVGDLERGDSVNHADAVRAFDLDAVAYPQTTEPAEMSVAVAADDRGARAARARGRAIMTGPKGQAAPGISGEHDKRGTETRKMQPGHGPGIRPGPGPNHGRAPNRLSLLPCTLEQVLRQLGLGVHPRPAGELPTPEGRQGNHPQEKPPPAPRSPPHDRLLPAQARAPAATRLDAPRASCPAAGVAPWAKFTAKAGGALEATDPRVAFCTQGS